MFIIINEKNKNEIGSGGQLLNFFKNMKNEKNIIAKVFASKNTKCIETIAIDAEKWFISLDSLSSITGNYGFNIDELLDAIVKLSEGFLHNK